MAVLVLAGCATQPPDVALGGNAPEPVSGSPAPPQSAPQSGAGDAWRHLATTEGMLPDRAAAAAVESTDDLKAAWDRHAFPEPTPEVDFDRNVVLLIGQPDDACIDQLIELEARDGELRVKWLPPPGGCNLPLIFRIHAVEVDRRHLPSSFTYAFDDPFENDAAPATIEIQNREGQAPPPPEPPRAMTKQDLDKVFRGHAIRRCTSADDPLANQPDSGVVTDDPPPREETRASAQTDEVRRWLRNHGYRSDVDVVMFISRSDGVRPGVLVDGGAADKVQRLLDDEFGNGAVHVVENRYDFEAVDKAQRDLSALMGGEGPGSIVGSSGIPGPVTLSMIDPTREALDRVAAAVDPKLVCVSPTLSGLAGD